MLDRLGEIFWVFFLRSLRRQRKNTEGDQRPDRLVTDHVMKRIYLTLILAPILSGATGCAWDESSADPVGRVASGLAPPPL
jgi:hypothetical protein